MQKTEYWGNLVTQLLRLSKRHFHEKLWHQNMSCKCIGRRTYETQKQGSRSSFYHPPHLWSLKCYNFFFFLNFRHGKQTCIGKWHVFNPLTARWLNRVPIAYYAFAQPVSHHFQYVKPPSWLRYFSTITSPNSVTLYKLCTLVHLFFDRLYIFTYITWH